METLTLNLTGEIVSNKNSLLARLSNALITYLRKISREDIFDKSKSNAILRSLSKFIRVTHTGRYKKWVQDAKEQIISQIEYEPFFEKVHIDFDIYFNRHGIAGGDIENKVSSIMDLLVEIGIITDDNYECLVSYHACGEYRKNKPGAKIKIKVLNK